MSVALFLSWSRLIIALILMFAIIGQAVSSTTMPCAAMMHGDNHNGHIAHKAEHSGHQMMDESEHAHHMHHEMQESKTTSTMDCCDNDCPCPANACSSFHFLDKHTLAMFSLDIAERIELPNLVLNTGTTKSLYRPPITA